MTNDVVLWRDIAFDVSDIRSVEVAGLFLEVVEKFDNMQFCVYAGFGTVIDSGVTGFLARLRPLTSRIMRFHYTGNVEEYLQHLDLPAENMSHFTGKINPILFSGQMNALCGLTTTPITNHANWLTSIPNLTSLQLEPPRLGLVLPILPILDLLRSAPRIVNLKLSCFGILSDEGVPDERVALHHLETLDLPYSDFQTLANHLEVPNARAVAFHGSEYPPGYNIIAPLFQAPHLFAHLSSIPTYGRSASEVIISTAPHEQDNTFCISIKTHDGFSLDIKMCWAGCLVNGWEGYIRRSLRGLEEHISLFPGAHAGLYFWTPFSQPLLLPFTHSPRIQQLAIYGGFAAQLLHALAMGSGAQSLFPELKGLVITDGILDPVTCSDALVSCLRARGPDFSVYIKHEYFPWPDLVDLGCCVEGSVTSPMMCLQVTNFAWIEWVLYPAFAKVYLDFK